MHVRQYFFGMPPGTPDQMRKLGAKLEELAPSSSATHVARACMQYMDWQFDEAKKSWEEAIRLNPRNEFAHPSYGCTLDKFGDSSNALKHLKAAADLEPGKAIDLQRRSQSWSQRHRSAGGRAGDRDRRGQENCRIQG